MKDYENYVFNVGQGLFNLFLGTNDDDEPYCGVFDCGNFNVSSYDDHLGEACFRIDSFPGNILCINEAVISHQDIDHWRNFLEFMLNINGYAHNSQNWYEIKKSNNYKYFNYMDDNVCQNFYIIKQPGIYYADHSTYVFSKHILASGFSHVSSDPSKSLWTIDFISNQGRDRVSIKMKYIPDKDEYKINLMPPFGPSASAPLHGLRNKIIDLIATIKVEQEYITEIYEVFNPTFNCLIFNLAEFVEISNNALLINRYIKNLYTGGLDCSASYSTFKCCIGCFANNIYSQKTFASLSVNLDFPDIHQNKFELDILNHVGEAAILSESVYRNATGQITVLHVSRRKFMLFPGDSTVHTFSSALDLLKEHFPGHSMVLFLAPHHGSYHTNFAYEISAGKLILRASQPLKNLLTAFPPESVAISAEHTEYAHPSELFLNTMEEHCANTTEEPHTIGWCPNGVKSTFKTKGTTKRIFSTECNDTLMFSSPPISSSNHKNLRKLTLPDNDLFISFKDFDL